MYEFNAPGYFAGSTPSRQWSAPQENAREQLDELGRAIHDMWAWQWEEGVDEQWDAAERALGAASLRLADGSRS